MPAALLFDLDGTLTDSQLGITRCVAHALQRMGRPVPDLATLTWCVGPPLSGSLGKLLETEDVEEVKRCVLFYRERFATEGLFENQVYPGVPEVLDHFRAVGHRLFVATSKPLPYAVRILEHFGLDRFFEAVYGSGLDGTLVDKAELIAHALQSHAIRPDAALMIGDREHDVLGARANGLPALGVLYGYGSQQELTGAGAAALCSSPMDLPACVAQALAAERSATPDK